LQCELLQEYLLFCCWSSCMCYCHRWLGIASSTLSCQVIQWLSPFGIGSGQQVGPQLRSGENNNLGEMGAELSVLCRTTSWRYRFTQNFDTVAGGCGGSGGRPRSGWSGCRGIQAGLTTRKIC